MHTPEEREKYGQEELEILRHMYERWLRSDVEWAVAHIHEHGASGAEDEWEFMRTDWLEKFDLWIKPYLTRLHETEYVIDEELKDFTVWIHSTIELMMQVLQKLGETLNGRE